MNPEGMVALLNYREDGVTRTSRRKLLSLLIELTVLHQLSSPSGSTASRPSSSRWSYTGVHTVSLSLSFLLVSSVSRIGYIAGGSVPPCMMYHCLYRKIHNVVYQAPNLIDVYRDSSSRRKGIFKLLENNINRPFCEVSLDFYICPPHQDLHLPLERPRACLL